VANQKWVAGLTSDPVLFEACRLIRLTNMPSISPAACRPAARRKSRGRSALTLLEVVLVLAVMIAIGAIVTPRLQKSLARQRVKNSGEMVRTFFNDARVKAMKSGKIQLFRCELETSRYTVSEWESADDGSARDAVVAGDPTTAAAATLPLETSDAPASTKSKSLPEGVRFVMSESLTSKRSAALEDEAFGGSPLQEDASQSSPILFYPDGSTSHSQVILADQKGNAVIVKLRGMTGLASIGDIKPLSELTGK
jgi:Tfp pilus assembly protein FimT